VSKDAEGKILGIDALCVARETARRGGERLVHCHGCFDIVHPGHIRHLQYARSLGDRLLVSITADAFVGKGEGRPLFGEDLRAENLAALSMVDWVCVSHAGTAQPLLDRVKPDIYVKGREYEANEDPRFAAERETVERHGGRVVFSSGDVVFSSTALVGALHEGHGAADGFEDPVSSRLRRLGREHDLSAASAARLLDGARDRRIVIVGEPMIDRYVFCTWPRVAGESPVLSLRPVEETSFDGGAAVLALHAAALGARPHLVAPLPRGRESDALVERLSTAGVDVHQIEVDGPLPVKERMLVGRDKLVKLDRVAPLSLDSRARATLQGTARELGEEADAAIIADYATGSLGPTVVRDACEALRPRVRVLAGDVSGATASLAAMRGADWLSPTESEMRSALGEPDKSLPAVAWELARRTRARNVVVTMGPEGLVAFRRLAETQSRDGAPSMLSGEHIPALTGREIDPLGCGDALLAVATLTLAAGGDAITAAFLGSAAAAVQAESQGNHPIERGRLLGMVRRHFLDGPLVSLARQRERTPTTHSIAS